MKKLLPLTVAAAALLAGGTVQARNQQPVKVGIMLPFSGTYAKLGEAIDHGFKLYVKQQGGELAGRKLKYYTIDAKADPSKATANANKLIKHNHVDVLVGPVHSGVAMAMAHVANETHTLMIDPNAGAMPITGPMCSMNFIRTSFNNWQPGYAMGVAAAKKGWKTAMTITWNYTAGKNSVQGFVDGFTKRGGKIEKKLWVPFPKVQFQSLLTEIAAKKPDVVYTFFAGGGAVKFVKDWAAAGLKEKIPLVGAGFLTSGTLGAQGKAAEGILTTLHYADNLDNPKNKAFRKAFKAAYGKNADAYAVAGYDTAQVLAAGLEAVNGDVSKQKQMEQAMRDATVDSPRGKFTFTASGDPKENFYLRKVENGENEVVDIAVKNLGAPHKGCKLSKK
jgi:branched-chain amino acid transport system substrate-binding protein